MEAERAVCLSEDRGSCVFLYEVSSVKYALPAKEARERQFGKEPFNNGLMVIQKWRMWPACLWLGKQDTLLLPIFHDRRWQKKPCVRMEKFLYVIVHIWEPLRVIEDTFFFFFLTPAKGNFWSLHCWSLLRWFFINPCVKGGRKRLILEVRVCSVELSVSLLRCGFLNVIQAIFHLTREDNNRLRI